MKIIHEFKEFALKGNAVELAIGIVIGAAFNSVINSLVKDIITPPIGKLLAGVDFNNFFVVLSGSGTYTTLADAQKAGVVTLNYGAFINNLISFVIVAWVLFIVVKLLNRLRRHETPTPTIKTCPYCKSNISVDAIRCPNCTSNL